MTHPPPSQDNKALQGGTKQGNMNRKPAPHTKQFFVCRPAPGRAYTVQSQPVQGAECIPVMGAKPARELQKELNAALPRKRNGWQPGERPPGSGRKKLEIPTRPVTLRISEDVLALYPEDVYERNREMVAAIINAKKCEK